MNLIQRIVNFVVPPPPDCGHRDEIHKLRNQVQAAKLARELAEREQRVIERARQRAAAEVESLSQKLTACAGDLSTTRQLYRDVEREIFHTHPVGIEYVSAIDSLRVQHERSAAALVDASAALEEATARIATLEQELRAAKAEGFRAQTSFASVPSDDERLPIPEDVVVSDKKLELAYRLIGIFFEGRQHWLLARGEERIKVPIHDADWLEQMRRGEVQFRAGDTLLAEFRVITYRGGNGDVWAEHTVERVIRVIHADEQIEMPLSGDRTEVAHA